MKIVKQAAEYLDISKMSPYQVIERVGRTCYKSEDKITENSASKFVSSLVKSGHHAMIEFGYIYMKITDIDFCEFFAACKPDYIHMSNGYVVGSFRAFYDWFNAWLNGEFMFPMDYFDAFMDLIWCLKKEYPHVFEDLYIKIEKKYDDDFIDAGDDISPIDVVYPFAFFTREDFIQDYKTNGNFTSDLSELIPHVVKFTTDRGISHEIVRHRLCSFAQESTRYCNYTKGKFGGEITMIEPLFTPGTDSYRVWLDSCMMSESTYFTLIDFGVTPQEARDVLPTGLKTDIWVGAFEDEWQHIINLRMHGTTGAPHPKIKALMELVYPDLQKYSEGRIK